MTHNAFGKVGKPDDRGLAVSSNISPGFQLADHAGPVSSSFHGRARIITVCENSSMFSENARPQRYVFGAFLRAAEIRD